MWGLTDVSEMYGASVTTVKRHIDKLKKEKKFKKSSLGKYFNYKDVSKLADLLGFEFNGNGKHK